ncbi:multiple sugar transport system permease protein [Devosia enhydra]|uniref:Multiple sugar transport system permease protein n=1 Tax=Devosia enhydra TaxID=665118 RepID=A0A1K2HZA3_9HYPH|nr:sugar ABC transporter permease [Devosia enhydra]SFZ85416.1 multiple sugar transport system permease protein [Devosia enhydra]
MQSRLTSMSYVLPAFAAMTLVLFAPVIYGFWFSLYRIQYGVQTGFIGLGNYARLLTDPSLGATFWRTVVFASATVALTTAIALCLAVWINGLGNRRGFIAQMIIILPWIISTVVATLLFRWVFLNDIGLAISLARTLGFSNVHPLNDPNGAMGWLIAVSVWKRIGYALIIILAGLKGIPEDYNEAARIDGASDWQIFSSITLPLLKTPLLLIVIVLTLSSVNTVETPLVLTGGGPGSATRILPMDVFDRAFLTYDLGSASSLAVMMFCGNVLLVLAYVRLARWKV